MVRSSQNNETVIAINNPADISVIVIYFVVVLAVGIWVSPLVRQWCIHFIYLTLTGACELLTLTQHCADREQSAEGFNWKEYQLFKFPRLKRKKIKMKPFPIKRNLFFCIFQLVKKSDSEHWGYSVHWSTEHCLRAQQWQTGAWTHNLLISNAKFLPINRPIHWLALFNWKYWILNLLIKK